MTRQVIPEYKCKKCGWVWLPRTLDPISCPNPQCRTPLWKEDRGEDGKLLNPKKRKRNANKSK